MYFSLLPFRAGRKDSILSILAFERYKYSVYEGLANRWYFLGIFVNKSRSTPIGSVAIIIPTAAIANNAIFMTNNEKHFSYIPNISIEN